MAELEKLGPKYRIALRLAKDPRFQRIPCAHKGTYADDCIVNRITEVRARGWLGGERAGGTEHPGWVSARGHVGGPVGT